MRLSDLIGRFGGELRGSDVELTGITHDSRRVDKGDLFVALDGEHHRGFSFVPNAISRGAAAVLGSNEALAVAGTDDLSLWIVSDPERIFGSVAEAIYGEPTRALRVFGITGTNGKTTIAHLVSEALKKIGRRVAVIGTGALRFEEMQWESPFTTPFGDRISRFARTVVDAGASDLVMEVSSHALAQHRADGVRFDFAAFSNLTRDHLDYHKSFEAYRKAKERLLHELAPRSVVNIDDPVGRELAQQLGRRAFTISARGKSADLVARNVRFHAGGTEASLATPFGELALDSRLHGAYNLENLLIALGLGVLAGEGREYAEALCTVGPARGRLDAIPHPRGATVFVDYAHTPDALRGAMDAIRPLSEGRLIAVFGCGGDRDRGKRPMMGAIAAEKAEIVILTSDNPRSEDPSAIIEEIRAGLEGSDADVHIEVDRARAIELALDIASEGDLVLVAGKGHENYQIIGDQRLHFDDREVIVELLGRLA